MTTCLSARKARPDRTRRETVWPSSPFVELFRVRSDAELAGDGTHVQLADVAGVALLALLRVEDGAAAVGVDAEADAEVARVELAGRKVYADAHGGAHTHTRATICGRGGRRKWGRRRLDGGVVSKTNRQHHTTPACSLPTPTPRAVFRRSTEAGTQQEQTNRACSRVGLKEALSEENEWKNSGIPRRSCTIHTALTRDTLLPNALYSH